MVARDVSLLVSIDKFMIISSFNNLYLNKIKVNFIVEIDENDSH